MSPAELHSELFAQLGERFTGEAVFDCLPDLVFFIKNERGEYVVVNQTLVERCGKRKKSELSGGGRTSCFRSRSAAATGHRTRRC